MLRLVTLGAGAAAAALCLAATFPTAEAQPAHKSGRCLYLNNILGQRTVDDHTVYLREGGGVWRLDFSNNCSNAENETLVFFPLTNNGVICSAIELNVRIRATGQSCVPSNLRLLSSDEAAALPLRDRP
jgi:hypothetical protein